MYAENTTPPVHIEASHVLYLLVDDTPCFVDMLHILLDQDTMSNIRLLPRVRCTCVIVMSLVMLGKMY